MKKQPGYILAGAGLVVAGLVAAAATARSSQAGDEEIAGHRFSERSLEGAWGFGTEVGWLVPPTVPELTPTTAVGRIVFDGEGGCQVSNVMNVNGVSNEFKSSTCTYSVEPNGMGRAEAVVEGAPFPGPISVSFVIIDRGRELRLQTNEFIVGTFSARRQ
jgi:hypothetical protein